MKNKYLKKILCITIISIMVLTSGPVAAMASLENTAVTESQDTDFVPETPTPDETPIPTPTPSETPEPTPIPSETPTPTPSETPTPTPTPSVTPSVKPTPDISAEAKINWIIQQLDSLGEITLDSEDLLKEIREVYESLSEEERLQVTNYHILLDAEDTLNQLKDQASKDPVEITIPEDQTFSNEAENSKNTIQEGNPVYLTDAVYNLHAGKEFYLESLKSEYNLEFSDDFADVMDEIEKEYKKSHKLLDNSDKTNSHVTSSQDTLLVRNWQDILAVYVYEQKQNGKSSYVLDRNAKEDLTRIFAMLNPVIRDKQDITRVTYGNRHINYYIREKNVPKKDRAFLQKYVETDCELLCATITAANGFVRQSVGDDVSEERVNVIASAYTLVGKIGYFWGGKSNALGWDSSWGTPVKVDAEGSVSTGFTRAYGLDCSGFVSWAFNNGYWDTSMGVQIGDGTTDQWNSALTVGEADAQPGDLVFQRGPEAGSNNHVGILCGQTDSGDWIAVHCSSSQNGVTVGEAYSASFRYIRRPVCYPSKEELLNMTQVKEERSQDNSQQKETWTKLLDIQE